MERLTRQGELGPYWDKCVFSKHGGMEEDLIIDRLAHYEDLEEQGRLVVLPDPRPLEKMGKMIGGTFIVNLTAQEITSILEAYFAGELVSKAALAASGKEG